MERKDIEEVELTEFENWLCMAVVLVVSKRAKWKIMETSSGVSSRCLRMLGKDSIGTLRCGSGAQEMDLDSREWVVILLQVGWLKRSE